MKKPLRHYVASILAGSLLFAALPLRFGVVAQSRQAEESLSSLIGLLREAESMARTEMMPGELKSIREAASHARGGNLRDAATATEMLRVRTMLREIIDDPRGESPEFQEKIANSLKLVEDYLAMGDGNGLRARTDTAFGLITTTFDTLEGTVSVNLPDDVAAGDTISGTVIAEPKGNTKDEQAKNEDSLNGYVVEVAKQETPPQQKQGSKWVIPPVAQFIPIVLKNRQGKEVARTNVPVDPGNPNRSQVVNAKPNGDIPIQGSYSTPPFGQAGRPVSVNGPFDGDFGNTYIKLGNNGAQFLAESPRKVVVRSPANLIGQSTIEVNEQNRVVATCNYQSIGVRLSADKLNLVRGEQTMLTLTFNGLNGVTSPVSAQLTNASPWVVRMAGGESQVITAQPDEFTGGVFTAKRILTGLRAGGFTINAVVNPTILLPGVATSWKTCSGGTTGGPDKRRLDDVVARTPGEPSRLDEGSIPKSPRPDDRLKPTDDPKLEWTLVNRYGIDVGSGSFHAGRTLDVLTTKRGDVIAASETGGVWLLPRSSAGVPVSTEWENTEVNCLAFGPEGEGHVYAGLRNFGTGTTLLETDTSTTAPLLAPWKPITIPDSVGTIYQIAVISSLCAIVLACDGGVLWSQVPAAGGSYDWTRAEGLPYVPFFSVAEAKDGSLVAGPLYANGIFVGKWNSAPLVGSSRLVMHRALVSRPGFVDPDSAAPDLFSSMYRISIDSCAADRSRLYAMTVGKSRILNSVLASRDGGETWTPTPSGFIPEGGLSASTIMNKSLMGDNTAGGEMHRLRVSPVDPNVLTVGGLAGYVSRDGGTNWIMLAHAAWDKALSLHADIHEVDFDPNDSTGKTLISASDGGVAVSTDLGDTWTDRNKTYASLQLYGTSARGFYGAGALSREAYGDGTQDNGNIYTLLTGPPEPWKKLDGGDGGQWHSFRLGGFIRSNMNEATIWRGVWNADKRVVEDRGEIPVRVGAKDITGSTVGLIAANVNSPAYLNAKGQLMYTVGALGGRIHGLFANDDGSDIHWESLSEWIPPRDQMVSAVGSASGEKIYLATGYAQGAQMYVVDTATASVSPLGALPPPLLPTTAAAVLPKARIHRFVVLNDEIAFCLYNNDRPNGAFLLKTSDAGKTWELMTAPSKGVASLELDWTTGWLYLCDAEHVYVSRNQGKTWGRASLGLPEHCQGIDLRFVAQPDGKNYLYLATYGWSLWRLRTNP